MNQQVSAYRQKINEERDGLLKLPVSEINKLSHADQYMRMRYEREIEGDQYVKLLRSGLSYKDAALKARENADEIVRGLCVDKT
jgi:hypothetical protein